MAQVQRSYCNSELSACRGGACGGVPAGVSGRPPGNAVRCGSAARRCTLQLGIHSREVFGLVVSKSRVTVSNDNIYMSIITDGTCWQCGVSATHTGPPQTQTPIPKKCARGAFSNAGRRRCAADCRFNSNKSTACAASAGLPGGRGRPTPVLQARRQVRQVRLLWTTGKSRQVSAERQATSDIRLRLTPVPVGIPKAEH